MFELLTIRVRVLLPFVSIKNNVGIVDTTWIAPYPSDAYKACTSEYPALTKMVEL